MSNGSTFPPHRRLGVRLALALAALLAVCSAGWWAWGSSRGDGPAKDGAPKAAPAPSAPGPSQRRSDAEAGGAGTGDGKSPTTGGDRPEKTSDDADLKGNRATLLKGKVVLLDPGHNPGNREHPREISRSVDVGNGRKECDTTGTATNAGYSEAAFTLDVARRARTLLRELGATVVFTQDADRPYGPCVNERAAAGNTAGAGNKTDTANTAGAANKASDGNTAAPENKTDTASTASAGNTAGTENKTGAANTAHTEHKTGADAAVSIHADGSGAGHRGFHVILPARVTAGAADTSPIVKPSRELGERLADRFAAATGSARSNYIGGGTGLDVRADLGGLNLSTIPKVFIECGNMRDPRDAAQFTDPEWRQKAARGITEGITDFLTG
ncbi:N-acetylmuramoyl-L-alanine amidase [Streptomyces sp. NPDC003077]|uniref:N-acetylmuramoyl-L-alanine amidase n=1 Tax=Streptomyces sp. NPDC003077 TaxID=3154443 RepID=UPI0033BB4A57